MLSRGSFRFCLLVLLPLLTAENAKRPLTHQDYDGWRSISNQRLSPDGKYLAYGVFPQEGEGEVVLRNLVTGTEVREPAGVRPPPAPPDPAAAPEDGPPPPRTVAMNFSEDSGTLVFATFPVKARTGQPAPKGGMTVVDLASGKATRIARVKSFQLPARASGYLAYLRESAEPAKKEETAPTTGDASEDQRGGTRTARGGTSSRPEFGSDLVLRKLADASERTFPEVVEYSLSEDGASLIYAVGSKEAAGNGVYAARTSEAGEPVALLKGKGKYAKLTWDEKQSQLAFLSDRDTNWKIYRWDRKAAAAKELVSSATPGFRSGLAISDRGAVGFSKDGARLFFGAAPPSRTARPQNGEDAAVVDLWHWKDDYIQPMQKVRAERDRNKSYIAAYLMSAGKVVQLGDTTMPEIAINDSAEYVTGSDDRTYRRAVEYDERFTDSWILNLTTGDRTKVVTRHRGALNISPGGRYGAYFDGKDWISVALPSGKAANLTASLGVKFQNEDHDSPGSAAAYGIAGWTRDGHVLLYDRFDIWQAAPDGSGAKNLTAGAGRAAHLQFRLVRLGNEDDPRDRWIDSAQPMLLRAEDLVSRDTGFWRGSFQAARPVKLGMAAKYFTAPVKAKHADVYVLTSQSFRECPDLLVTDSSFREMRKVSNINPQQEQFTWGSAEMVQFKNVDGVPLQGVLYKPDNFDPQKKYPMLVYIYERLSQGIHRYNEPKPGHSINITYYTSNGYLVLTPDIVYTIGYPGQSALKAVLPAVQSIVDRGYVDENAIGIQGHSWGGYQIAYMITQTNRFRAVAAGAPVADMISAYDGIRWGPGVPRQFQYERTQSRIGGSIWQYPTRFIENSPIFWADRVQTPVMMVHNDGDDAVPWYQGIEYYLALRRLGKEVYLFNYNGEPHGLRKRPNQKDYTVRLQQYFDHYLKGAPAPAWMEKGIPYLER